MKSKVCPSCKIEKYISEFCKDQTKKDGLRCSCKNCEGRRRKKKKITIYSSIKDLLQKQCSKCGEVKWVIHFAPRQISRDGFHKRCRKCVKKYNRKFRLENVDITAVWSHKHNLKRHYGLTIEDYNKIFEEQHGCCAICGKHQSEFNSRLCVDHNHKTGEVRGLLCSGCNTKVGIVENNDFEKIHKYLKGQGL